MGGALGCNKGGEWDDEKSDSADGEIRPKKVHSQAPTDWEDLNPLEWSPDQVLPIKR